MTEVQLQAIKERAERVDPNRYDANNIFHSQLDVPALIAEVERLRELVNEIAGDVAEHTANTLRKTRSIRNGNSEENK